MLLPPGPLDPITPTIGKWTLQDPPLRFNRDFKYTALCDCGRREIIQGKTYLKGKGCAGCRKKVRRDPCYLYIEDNFKGRDEDF